jgi:hypothetical protein
LSVDIVGGHEGEQVKQVERSRSFGLQALDGDGPGFAYRAVDYAGMLAVAIQVLLDGGGGPFHLPILAGEVVRREHGDGARGAGGGLVHLENEIGTGRKSLACR